MSTSDAASRTAPGAAPRWRRAGAAATTPGPALKRVKQVAALLIGATVLVALVVSASIWAFGLFQQAADARQRSYDLIMHAESILSGLAGAESAQRGYLLSGDEAFLKPYLAVRDSVRGDLDALRPLPPAAAAAGPLDALALLVEAKLAHMARIIELRRDQGMAAVLGFVGKGAATSGEGKRLMDSIRAEIGQMVQAEQGALALHEAHFQANLRRMFAGIVAISLLALLSALGFATLSYRQAQQRMRNLLYLETKRLLDAEEATNAQLQQANITLLVSEARLAVTLNSIGDGVIATDAEGRVTLLNPLAQRLTGWTQAEAEGRPVDDIFHIISLETRLPAAIPVKETLAHGTAQGLADHTILIARDGSECAIADSCAPIRDHGAQVVGAVLVFRDVTGEYAAQQARREHQVYTRSLFESNIDPILTADPSGIITDVNNQMEALTGCARAELIGTPFRDYFTDPERAAAGIRLALAEKKLSNYELTARARDGRQTFVSFNAATFHDATGALKGVFAAARDITESKQQDRALQEQNDDLESARSAADKANLAKSEFLSSMSHELRTPLNAVLGFAQVMESGSPPPSAAQKRSLDQILKAGWYLLELINEILDLARIESGRLMVSREPVALDELMLECRTMIEPQARLRDVSMEFAHFDRPCYVLADRTRLKQVLINLLFNAIKYNKPGGRVTVDWISATPDSVRVSVLDTGAGLAPEELAQLFQPFNRIGKETGIEEGTGIGLVLAKQLVELMGGIIGVDSTVGTGTLFWVELALCTPPRHAADADASAAARQPPAAAGAAVHTLLYVEDNPANLRLVEELLGRRPDLRLLTAADAPLGIALAREFLPDVILMDINLPGISGTEAMTMLREDAATGHIPIVAISANAIPGDIRRGLEAGFLRYLTKPIVINEFMRALDVALEHSAAHAANRNTEKGVMQ